jgi:hypothetical protein
MTSIWLRLEGRQEQQLQQLINRVSEEHAAVAFAPHLTVCSVPAISPCSPPRRLTSANVDYCR